MSGRAVRRVRSLAALAAGTALAAGAALAAPAALAQDESPARPLVVQAVDARQYPTVSVLTSAPEDAPVEVVVNDEPVGAVERTAPDDLGFDRATVLVVDTSAAMEERNALDLARLGLAQVVKGKDADEIMAVVTFDVVGQVAVPPTRDERLLLAGLDRLHTSARRDASRNEGVREAADVLRELGVHSADLVLVTASTDQSSTVSQGGALASALGVNASVHAVGIDFGALDVAPLRTLASATPAGTLAVVDSQDHVASAVAATRRLVDTASGLTFEGPADATVLRLEVRAGDATARAVLNAGQLVVGSSLLPGDAAPVLGKGPSFLRDADAKWIALGLALAAFVLLAFGLFLLLVRDGTDLEKVLRHYDDRPEPEPVEDEEGGMVQSRLLQRAVALTSQLAESRGLLTKVEKALERADLPLRPAEASFFYCAIVVVGLALSLLLLGNPLLAIGGAVLVGLVPPAIVNLKAGKRRSAFQAQLPDMLQLLAGSLRAGYSMMQAVEAVSQEVEDPMGKELRRVVVEARLGRPLDIALEDAAERMGSPDFAWAVMAIRIQREVGGNLAELLLTVADTMVQRERLRRDVKSLTAEGRVSAVVLAILPPALMGAMYTVNPEYVKVLFNDRLGNMMLAGSVVLALGGFVWMKKLAKVEV